MRRFSIIDLPSLGKPDVIKIPDQEVILSDRMNTFRERWRANDPPMGLQYDVGMLEFDPAKVTQETDAVYQLNVETRINQTARSLTLAFATGNDLDAIASRYPGGVPRVSSEIYSSTAPVAERTAKDDRYRYRIWTSPFALAAAGTPEAYVFFALTFVPEARDASAVVIPNGTENVVTITLLMDGDDPSPTTEQIFRLYSALTDEAIKPATDVISIAGPVLKDVSLTIDTWLYPWADQVNTLRQMREAVDVLHEDLRYLGNDHTLDDLKTALNQIGVHHTVIGGFQGQVISADKRQMIRVLDSRIVYQGRDE